MYERNAIVIERYFNQLFGYNNKSNLKTNFKYYTDLIDDLEKYQHISEEEENIILEYDLIANKIREIQKVQEELNKKNHKFQEEREYIFQNIDESSSMIQKKINNINNNLKELDQEINENAEKFVSMITEFNEKSTVRTTCERSRRKIENEYNKKLNETLDDYQATDINYVKRAKKFFGNDTTKYEEELREKINKNGEKEKIPFDSEIVDKAIMLSIDIQKKETDILTNIYEKINKLLTEIKNENIQIDKHKKIIKDSKSKLEIILSIKEYLIQFLDNERATVVNGEEEHKTLMKETCKNIDEDLVQINNLYTILQKEITKKATNKVYDDLYNIGYLRNLRQKTKEFDNKVKKLKLPIAVINPNYWRIDSMQKIYDIFYKLVTENYGRDLSQYTIDDTDESDEDEEIDNNDIIEENIENNQEYKNEEKPRIKSKKEQIDEKIDMILGINKEQIDDNDIEYNEEKDDELFYEDSENQNNDELEQTDENKEDGLDDEENAEIKEIEEDEEDDWDDEENDEVKETEEDEEDDWDDEENDEIKETEDDEEDDWDDEENDEIKETEDDEEDDWYDEVEDEWEEYLDDDDDENDEKIDHKDKLNYEENQQQNNSDSDVDIWGNSLNNAKKKNPKHLKEKKKKNNSDESNWEDEFINIEKNDNKKKGFFNKFKK